MMAQSNIRGKIVIIGAGISGIAAAHSLHKAGATDVLIVEAKDRVGGRIFTQKLDGKALDLGAEFIHGSGGNAVHALAASHHLVASGEEEGDSDEDPETKHYYTQKGQNISPDIVREVSDVLDEIFQGLNHYSRNNLPISDDDETIGTFVYRKFYEYLQAQDDSEEVIRYKESLFNWRLLFENSDNACKSLYELSVYGWGEYVECHGDPELRLDPQVGFRGVLDPLLAEIPASWLRLQCPVKLVYWDPSVCVPFVKGLRTNVTGASVSPDHHAALPSDQYPIQIMTASGDIIPADHVIVTCSLGFLKSHAHTMFRPLLPTYKMAVIQHMGFGTVNKIFLQFETPFWDKDCEVINLAWMIDEPFVLRCVDNKHTDEYLHNDWFRAIYGFEVVPGHAAVLEGWIAGEEAEVMENVPDQVVMEICLEILKRFTGNHDIPRPKKIIRTSWHKDNQVRGSYSYIKAGHTAVSCEVLARPLDKDGVPRLMFAGEATHRQYYSTTHGALLSGQREAERIIKYHADVKDVVGN